MICLTTKKCVVKSIALVRTSSVKYDLIVSQVILFFKT